jgi:type IX secretion system substrate protein/beta-propeller repeat-containing protein
MKKLLLSFLISGASFFVVNAQINIQWQTRYTSAGSNVDRAEDLFRDAAGNVYVTGLGLGASGNFDYITIKYDPAGAQLWKSEYNGPGNSLDEAHAITVDAAGNVYVTGWSYGGAGTGYDYATVKYNSAGVQQWASRYTNTAGGTDEAWDIGADNAGNVFVTGSSDGSGTNSAAATVRYNSAGVQQFANRFEGAGNSIDAGYAIFVDAATGEAYITGYTFRSTAADFNYITIKYNLAGAQQWATEYNSPDANYDEAHAIAVDASGNVYVTGTTQTLVLTNFDYGTVKYNSAGVQQWAMRYNGTGNDVDRANAIVLDASGNVYITGKSVGAGSAAEDAFTIKYNNAGATQWTARYNGPANGYDEGKAIAVDAAGAVYITGYSFTAGANNDYTTIKYDAAGTQEWITKYNGTGNNVDQAAGISVDALGNVFISGLSKGAGSNEDFETIKYCQLTSDAGNDTTICNGSSVQLNATAPGAASYAWSPATGLDFTNVANPIATPSSTTTYVVAITNTNGCTDNDTIVVTVVPLPAPAITPSGPTSFCSGGSVTLTSATGTTYQWSTGVNDTLASITVSASGTYSVMITNGTGCSAMASQTVTVFSLPPISAGPDDSTCLSTNIQLTASGGISYIWHPGSTLSDSTIVNPVAGPTSPTCYYVVGTAAGGCSNTDTVCITVLGNPSLPTITEVADSLVCSPSYAGYQWYYNGSLIPGATDQDYDFTLNGNYYVQVFNVLGCSTASVIFNVNNVGIAENSELSLMNLYPNPTSGNVTLEFNLNDASSVQLNVMNISGQVIYSETMNAAGNFKKQIDLSGYANGIYYLQAITNDKVINRKIIKN